MHSCCCRYQCIQLFKLRTRSKRVTVWYHFHITFWAWNNIHTYNSATIPCSGYIIRSRELLRIRLLCPFNYLSIASHSRTDCIIIIIKSCEAFTSYKGSHSTIHKYSWILYGYLIPVPVMEVCLFLTYVIISQWYTWQICLLQLVLHCKNVFQATALNKFAA